MIFREVVSASSKRRKGVIVWENTPSENEITSTRVGRHSNVKGYCIIDVKVNIVDILVVVVSRLNWDNEVSSDVREVRDQIIRARETSLAIRARNSSNGNVSNSTIGAGRGETNKESSGRNSTAGKVDSLGV